MNLNTWDKYRDGGLLIFRTGLGIMFIYHGAPKMFAGPQLWYEVFFSFLINTPLKLEL
jgi:putative oxidoreductase